MDIQEYNKIAKDIADKYKHRILPRCRIFEQERVYEKNKRTFFISVFIFCVFLVIFSLVSNTSPSLKIISCIPLAIVSYIVNLLSEKNIERKIKKSIMPHLCSCFGDLEWIEEDINSKQSSYKKKENERLFIETGLFNLIPTVFEYDDVFKGSFKDSEFEIIELLASNRYKNNSIICFEGVIVKININKNIKAETIIRTKDIFWSLLGFEHIVLEDTEFNNNFNVYSEDEVEARYLITTSFMDRLNNLKNTFDVKKMSCAFYEKYFLIAFYDNKDAFRFGTFDTSLLDHKEFSRLTKEIMSIYEMIDCFKFGEKTRI